MRSTRCEAREGRTSSRRCPATRRARRGRTRPAAGWPDRARARGRPRRRRGRPRVRAQLDHPFEHGPWHRRPGRVVRRVDVDELRVRSQQPLERIEVVRPAVGVRAAPDVDGGAGRPRHGERRLVARHLDDGVVARPEEGGLDGEDALLGGGERDDRAGLRRRVEGCDRLAQLRRARNLGVSEPERREPLAGVGLEQQQLRGPTPTRSRWRRAAARS